MSPPAAASLRSERAALRRRIREPGCFDEKRYSYRTLAAGAAERHADTATASPTRAPINLPQTSADHVEEFHVFAAGLSVEFDAVPFLTGPFMVVDAAHPDHAIVYASTAFAHTLGYAAADLVGKSPTVFHGPDTSPQHADLLHFMMRARHAGFVKVAHHAQQGASSMNLLYVAPLVPAASGESAPPASYVIACRCDVTAAPLAQRAGAPASPFLGIDCASKVSVRGGASGCGASTFSTNAMVPNAGVLHITNARIDAHAFVKTRTSKDLDPRVARYFEGRRRKFELQMQFKLDRDTAADRLYLNSFLAEPMQLGFTTRALIRLIVGVLRKLSRGAQITFGDEGSGSSRAAIALPLALAADDIVATPPDGIPPALGVDLVKTDSPPAPAVDIKTKRQDMMKAGYKAGWTYTVAFYSMYLDLEEWSVCNLPGVRAIDLHNFWKDQSLHVGLSVLPEGEDPAHLQSKGLDLFYLDVVHASLPHYNEQ